jgi:hypothetical protein
MLLVLFGTWGVTAHAAPCTDAAAVAAARAAVDAACGCAAATNHGEYVACARGVIAGLVDGGELPRSCRGAVQRCAARSTCGRPDAVTCCRTGQNGVTRGFLKPNAAACRAPSGGSACVGSYPSLCDACDASGCTPRCGNNKIEAGEECEPPGTATCDDSCQQRSPGCGDGFVDANEECDGTAGYCATYYCGAPSDALACQCCAPTDTVSVFFEFYPPPCCDGGACRVFSPHYCTCDEDACIPAGYGCPTPQVGCCDGLSCVGGTCQ